MKIRSMFLAIAAMAVMACGQTAEEKVKAYEEAHDAMMTEYRQMMDSLATDRQAQEEYYNSFVEEYIDFNLAAAKKNSDNDVAVQVLMNLRGLIEDDQVDAIISKMSPEMLENEKVGHSLLQEIFLTQGSNLGLLHCRQILYHLSHQGSPRTLEWVIYPFSRGTFQSRN